MRAALFTDSDVFAGTERHILELARGLSMLGVEVALACPGDGELARRGKAAGLPVRDIPKRGKIDWRATLWLRKALRRGDFDLVHVHNGRTALIAAMAVRLGGAGRMVATQHFIEPSRVRRRGPARVVSSWLHRFVERRVDRFIAISQAVRDAMLARNDTAAGKINVVLNGIADIETAQVPPSQRVRDELGIASGKRLVAAAARLEPEKDLVTLVEAMDRVRTTCPQAICVIAGDGSERQRLQARIRELGLHESVRLIGFRKDVLGLIAAADLFVLPSLAEPFGLVILEAMALGKAVVATAAGGPLEIVAAGETGLLVAPADPAKLADAIVELIRDDDRRGRMGSAGRQRLAAYFTTGQMAAATLAVYRDVLPQRPRPDPGVSAPHRQTLAAEATSDAGR